MVQCYNMGSDGTDAAWKCEASMPDGYSFSSVEVKLTFVLLRLVFYCNNIRGLYIARMCVSSSPGRPL